MSHRGLDGALDVTACWARIADEIAAFAGRESLPPRDLVVLLPFAQHLPLARAAWLARGAAQWMPRFETTQTLVRALTPPAAAVIGALSFDPVVDRLQAARLLRRAGGRWAERDRRGFESAVLRVVETAQALARACAALPSARRAAWLEHARDALGAPAGPGAHERSLARLALEWAATADTAGADALHALQPGAWVAVRAGAVDPLVESLLAGAAVPALWLDADRPLAPGTAQLLACTDFEDEAQRSAAEILAHLARGERPVALIALDRVLVRRVRALLERQRVPMADETGWKLSTTRAGASVAGLLRALLPGATGDELIDWLRSTPRAWAGLDALEATWRKLGVTALPRADPAALPEAAGALWGQWLRCSEPLRVSRRLPLAEWLLRLHDSLGRAELRDPLASDAAGAQVLAALRCHGRPLPHGIGDAWAGQASDTLFDAADFRAWVDDVLEQVSFEPPLPAADAPVVITPLARAVLRPFAAVVCPGADEARLGAAAPAQGLLGDGLAAELGLPHAAAQRDAERRAFAQLLRVPRLTLSYRRHDGTGPLQASPLLLQLELAARRAGQPLAAAVETRVPAVIAPAPLQRPLPAAPALLPDTLSPTAYEALRACPYRYFAQRLLGLDEAEELDDTLDRRDYGTWLHAVLQDFHRRRRPGDPAADAALLDTVAFEQQDRLARDDADFLPYAATFADLAPRYLAWLHGEEAQGMAVRDTEVPLQALPAALAPLGPRLAGTLDRVDALPAAGGAALRVLDYKTGSRDGLRDRLRRPLEDTQLAFYAALIAAARGQPAGGLQAAYLALDGSDAPTLLPHDDVEASADALVAGVAADFARLRAGAALPALGEGAACAHCSARGLCRRDHWPDGAPR